MSNPERNQQIREAYRRHGGNIQKVARELGLTINDCRQAFPTQPVVVRSFPDEGPRPDKKTVGNAHLRPFIISIRHAHAPWPEEDRQALQRAKERFDAGTHIMVQGRDGPWIIQYCWKRLKAVAPVPYFYGVFA